VKKRITKKDKKGVSIKKTSKIKLQKVDFTELLKLENYSINDEKTIPDQLVRAEIFNLHYQPTKFPNTQQKPSPAKTKLISQKNKGGIPISPYLLNLKKQSAENLFEEKEIKNEKKRLFYFQKVLIYLKKKKEDKFWLIKKQKESKTLGLINFSQSLNKLVTQKFNLAKFNFSLRLKIALNFFIICLFLLLPIYSFTGLAKLDLIKEQITNHSKQALIDLNNAAKSTQEKNYQQASFIFNQAALNFAEANIILNNYHNILWQIASRLPIINKKINSAKQILKAGEKISLTASNLTTYLNQLNKEGIATNNLMPTLMELKISLAETNKQLELVMTSLNDLDENLIPQDYQIQYSTYKNQLPALLTNLQALQNSLEATYQILAPAEKKQYLVFFQNINEIRATGGFLGSYALITIENGEIKKMEIPGGGPYDLKGNFIKKVIAPEPMHLVGSRWQIWDANWWPDFPTSAKKIMWFYEASGGSTVDGVITINSNILPELLKVTGDIYLEKYNKLITQENVISLLQSAVEFEYDKTENKPKQIIAELAPILLEKLLKTDQEKLPELLTLLITNLKEKNIQMYFNEEMLQNKIINLGWGGQIQNNDGDYLMVVNQNIGGGKTDGVINQFIDHQSEILNDDTIIDTVKITRRHQGNPNDIFEKSNNVSYIRIYVPQGSKLLAIDGYQTPPAEAFKNIETDYQEDEFLKSVSGQVFLDESSGTSIYNEFGKTVFGQWLQVKPGEEKTLTLKYQLPFKLKEVINNKNLLEKIFEIFQAKSSTLFNYNLLIQKQSGVNNQIISYLTLPNNKIIKWVTSSDNQYLLIKPRNLTFTPPLLNDQLYSAIIE